MTNEEYVEEMYHIAHNYGVMEEFQNEVKKELNFKPTVNRYDVIHEVFYKFVSEGLIETFEV